MITYGEVVGKVHGLMQASTVRGGTGALVTSLVLLSGFVLAAAAILVLARLTARHDEDDHGDGRWGGNGGPPSNPPGPRPEGDPAWWTEFELEFAAYARAQRVHSLLWQPAKRELSR